MEQTTHSDLKTKTIVKSEIIEDEDDQDTLPSRVKVPRLKLPSPTSVLFGDLGISTQPDKQNTTITLGQSFKSFAEVSQAIRLYQTIHKVSLSQKYFRRIAANPKPTNKEDYSLSEDERKRFVYRWIDFCCKHFEGEAGGGYSMKECPMRIRFQLRFKEKDLIISIFRDDHDHEIPEGESQLIPTLTSAETDTVNASYDHITTTPPAAKNVTHHQNKKCIRPPPPLALSSSALGIKQNRGSTPYSMNSFQQKSLPKPPPLKKGCVATPISMSIPGIRETFNQGFDKERARRLPMSVESVVRNIYQYLYRMRFAGTNGQTELFFLTPNPDLIKITSDLSGVDIGTVLTTITSDASTSVELVPSTDFAPENFDTDSLKPRILKSSKHKTKSSTVPINDDNLCSSLNTQEQLRHDDETYEDSVRRLVDLPLEVIIKTDPDSIEYYDEDDSGEMTFD